MKEIILVVDLILDENDLDRLKATDHPYLYRSDSKELYLKHINHLDYHHPHLVLSYDKQHQIINLETRRTQQFYITNEGLTKPYGVAVGVTDHLAMIAWGDTNQTKIQVIDVDASLKVYLNTSYKKDTDQLFPIPRLFTGNPAMAQLVYFDASTLDIDLRTFDLGTRKPPSTFQTVPRILSPHLSILGPFILIRITPSMTRDHLYSLRSLLQMTKESSWIAVDRQTVVNRDIVPVRDFTEIIKERDTQLAKIMDLLDDYTKK